MLWIAGFGSLCALALLDWSVPPIDLASLALVPTLLVARSLNKLFYLPAVASSALAFSFLDSVGATPSEAAYRPVNAVITILAYLLVAHLLMPSYVIDVTPRKVVPALTRLLGFARGSRGRRCCAPKHLATVCDRTALLLLDIVNFKAIGLRYGSRTADCVQRAVADRISSMLAGVGSAVTFAAGECALKLPNADLGELRRLCESIAAVFAAPLRVEDHLIDVEIQIAVGVCPDDASMPEDLVHVARDMLYQKNLHIELGRERAPSRN